MNSSDGPNVSADYAELFHPDCIVCGLSNKQGLHMNFESGDTNDQIRASFHVKDDLQGYPGILHGGVIASVIDGAMTHCVFARGIAAVTVEMKLKFRNPVQTGKDASVHARLVESVHGLYTLEAEITQSEQVMVTAVAKFLEKPRLREDVLYTQAENTDQVRL